MTRTIKPLLLTCALAALGGCHPFVRTIVRLDPDTARTTGMRSSVRVAEADVEQALAIVADVARQYGLEPLTPRGAAEPDLAAYWRETPRAGLVLTVDLYEDGRVLHAETFETPTRRASERALGVHRSIAERFARTFGRHRVSTERVN